MDSSDDTKALAALSEEHARALEELERAMHQTVAEYRAALEAHKREAVKKRLEQHGETH